jgi:predicted MFS family arabinose efflux permease
VGQAQAQQTEERDPGDDRRVFFLRAAIFAAFSVSGGLAPNIWLLLACRFIMCIGGAMMWPAILAPVVQQLVMCEHEVCDSLFMVSRHAA